MVLGTLASNIVKKKKYCISGNVSLQFDQTVELTEEEFKSLNKFEIIRSGSAPFNILFDNLIISDYECNVDEYELLDIERTDD